MRGARIADVALADSRSIATGLPVRSFRWRSSTPLLAILLPSLCHAAGATDLELVLSGNDRILWACHNRLEHEGGRVLRFAYESAMFEMESRFLPLPLQPVIGRIGFAATSGRSLHLFYLDGTHRRYDPVDVRSSPAGAIVQFLEMNLPQSLLPAAVGGDPLDAGLFAAVTSRMAREVEQLRLARESRRKSSGSPTSATNEALVPPLSSEWCLVRYQGGQWRLDREGPPDLSAESSILFLAVSASRVCLIYVDAPPAEQILSRISLGPSEGWSDPHIVPLSARPYTGSLTWSNDHPVLLAAEGEADRLHVRSWDLQDDAWVHGLELRDSKGDTLFFRAPLSLALSESRVAAADLDSKGNARIGRWRLGTGEPIYPPTSIIPLMNRPAPPVSNAAKDAIVYGVLGVLLSALMILRKDALLRLAPLATGQYPARITRRLLAFLVDFALLSPLLFLALLLLWRADPLDIPLLHRLTMGRDWLPAELFWFGAVAGGIVGVYAAIFEIWKSATVGKRMFGLSVVRCDGSRCTVSMILVRNAARILEFHFPPVLVLVALTPGRQRVGDILARTIVVESLPVKDQAQPE